QLEQAPALQETGKSIPTSAAACSSCVGKIVEGEINQDTQKFLDNSQLDQGFALLCVTYPLSDCTIKTHQEPYLV
ncbi:MAG: 2Fe-2S iron-sulfur cluster binding domain-containing protein, partial [Sphaerospermopsis sp. SIO1G2]|nr:2Fe-2S iron-sulfur cluster binding domain-containing protein [Sphaerospermopsis sp. SIO1G2]